MARRTPRIIFMMVLIGSFMIVELVVGIVVRSLALVSDSYHMLSDLLALVIALVGIWVSILYG
jgi:zinc transporter 1